MEALQVRRSSTTPAVSHRLRNGKGRVQKQRNFPKLASDSSSWSSDTTEEDSFTCELGWRSSKTAVGTPMKKLLAEEMSRQTESKRRSPSVIARLMGLDGLPPQQSSHKHHKRSAENSVQKAVPTETTRRDSSSYGSRSSRKSSKEEQEFKDVFEVFDALKRESISYSLQGTAHSKVTKAEMAFIEQKFMNAKRLSANEELQNSKEFHDAIDDLDSNKDLLLKFLEQPDSLYAKHLHDLQGASLQSPCVHTHQSAIKSSHSPQYESSGLRCKIERDGWKNQRKPQDDPVTCSYSKSATHNPLRSSKIQLEGKDEPAILPTRIVVLKPNLGKVQRATKAVSSPRSSQNVLSSCRKHTELPGIKNRAAECGKKNFPDDAGPSRYKSRESREIAKEVTRQMRNSFGNGSMNISTSGFKGYAGDESTSNRSENESANESEQTIVTPRNSIGWRNRHRPSTSFYAESSVSREAKKRLSERWKITHKSVDMGVVSRSSTLGEMLAIPDEELRHANSDVMIGKKEVGEKFDGNDGTAGWEPFGISSSDGWKDGCLGNLSRSSSIPASSTFIISSTKTGIHRETPLHDRYMMPKQVVQLERNNAGKGNFNQQKGLSSRNSRSHTTISHAARCAYSDCSDSSPEILFWQNQAQRNVRVNCPLEQDRTVSETSASIVTDKSLVLENVLDVTIENIVGPSTNKESPDYMLAEGDSPTRDLETSQELSNMPPENCPVPMHHPVAELESPASSREADQPSPVSVLETPFPDDLSSGSECFESLSADLHGLRMQLQLLKLESDASVERPMLVSSDEDAEEGSTGFSEDGEIAQESREFSYITNMLVDSGINVADPDSFFSSDRLECPVSPSIFEELEKKYSSNHASWPRSERRLLFDRINLALPTIHEQFVDPYPWLRPASRIRPTWIKNGLKDGIKKMLASQDKKVNIETTAEIVLAREPRWLDMRDDIDVIGRDIEKLLTEELVKELVGM